MSEPKKITTGVPSRVADLTAIERRWLKAYLYDPDVAGNGVKCCEKVGLVKDGYVNTAALAYRLKRRCGKIIEAWFTEHDLSYGNILGRIADGMNATETKFFQHEGEVTEEREVIAWGIRYKYTELAAKMMGHLIEHKKVGLDEDTRNFMERLNERAKNAERRMRKVEGTIIDDVTDDQ